MCFSGGAVLCACDVAGSGDDLRGRGRRSAGRTQSARPGDTILLEEGAEFVGSFVLPAKTGNQWITLRTAAPDTVLPPTGMRIRPSHAPLLARLRSPTAADAALRTAAGAHHWRIAYLEFGASYQGNGDIVQIGDGSSAQNSLDKVPHDIVLSHLYIHGDPVWGQKRGIALNAAAVTIRDSHISDCKGVGQDTQAIGGWNGPGPYTIENNYLEAAGENVMFGGADPRYANLVADGITFRGNLRVPADGVARSHPPDPCHHHGLAGSGRIAARRHVCLPRRRGWPGARHGHAAGGDPLDRFCRIRRDGERRRKRHSHSLAGGERSDRVSRLRPRQRRADAVLGGHDDGIPGYRRGRHDRSGPHGSRDRVEREEHLRAEERPQRPRREQHPGESLERRTAWLCRRVDST